MRDVNRLLCRSVAVVVLPTGKGVMAFETLSDWEGGLAEWHLSLSTGGFIRSRWFFIYFNSRRLVDGFFRLQSNI